MEGWTSTGASLLIYTWCSIAEGVTLLLIVLLSPIWVPRRLRDARDCLREKRTKVLKDSSTCDALENDLLNQKDAAERNMVPANDLPDLGRRFLDFLAQGLGQGRAATVTTQYKFIDISVYDEVVLTTEWGADGFLACCMLFAAFTADGRGLTDSLPGGKERPYPLRTVIVGEGRTGAKANRVKEALLLMREMGIIPTGCDVGVFEGSEGPTERVGDASVVPDEQEAMPEVEMGREREDSDGDAPTQVRESFLASIGRKACELLLWRGRGEKRGVDRLREILTSNKRLQQRVLVVAMKPPRDLVKVLLEREWGWGSGGGGGHVDLLVSKSFSSALGEAGMGDAMRQLGDLDMDRALRMLHRVFVVQLDDLVKCYGFPKTIAPDRTPNLSAAMAGARGVLPSCLRQLVAASNHALLLGFPDKVAMAASTGRYGNEELWWRASEIAGAVRKEFRSGRVRLSELGACMADLVASDFEALEAAGLSPSSHQAVFRSLDVGMCLSDVAVPWALLCQHRVYWQHFSRLTTTAGKTSPISSAEGRILPWCGGSSDGDIGGVGRSLGGVEGGVYYSSDEYCLCGDACCERGDTTVCSSCMDGKELKLKGGNGGVLKEYGLDERSESREEGDDVQWREGFKGFVATGFADETGERQEDQEAGYADFAAFLGRVLDQMP